MAASVERGRALVIDLECTRCHEVPGLADAAPDQDCVGCHRALRAGTFSMGSASARRRWREHVLGIDEAPSLAALGRLKPTWLVQFLLHPHDLRPGLRLEMPRLPIDRAGAEDIVAFLRSASPRPAVDTEATVSDAAQAVAHGRALFEQQQCGRCHRYSPVVPAGMALDEAAPALAPDLGFVRERIEPGVLVSWLRDPRAWHAATLMPSHGLDAHAASSLASFLLHAPRAPSASAPPARLAVLAREVRFEEVEQRVFRKVCWHCHAAADFARGDGGPGNTGGFGFAPRHVDLATYEGIHSGGLDDQGQRRSLFEDTPLGPRLLAVLLARQAESRGEVVPGIRGMPLALPALTPEDIQLVESWIAQGRRR